MLRYHRLEASIAMSSCNLSMILSSRQNLDEKREHQDGSKNLYKSDHEEASISIRKEFVDGWKHIHLDLFNLDFNLIIHIMQFSAASSADLLAFAMTCKVANSIVIKNSELPFIGRQGFVRNCLETLCNHFKLPFHGLLSILQEYNATLSGSGSVFCVTNSFEAADCHDLDLYVPYDQGMRIISAVDKIETELDNTAFYSIPLLRPYRYTFFSAKIVDDCSKYRHSPIMALNIHVVLTFLKLPPGSCQPDENSKKLEFIILKDELDEDSKFGSILKRCLSFFDFSVCANSISLIRNESAVRLLSIEVTSASDLVYKRLVCLPNFNTAHHLLVEYCYFPESDISLASIRKYEAALRRRIRKVVAINLNTRLMLAIMHRPD